MATYEQHGYYRRKVLPALAEAWGDAVLSELHLDLKREHIPPDLWIWQDGEFKPPSTADLTVEQFSAFLQRVLNHAAQWQTPVPPPRGSE